MGTGRRRGRPSLPSGAIELALGILMAFGLVTAVLAGGPGEAGGMAGPGRLLGGAMVAFALAALTVVGIARLAGRSTGRATSARPAPPPDPLSEPIPELGWPGWRFRIGHTAHEVWVSNDVTDTRLLCDGRWVEPEWLVPWSGRLEEVRFLVGGHPARLIFRFDPTGRSPGPRGVTSRVEPGFELLVDGVADADIERVTAGWVVPPIRMDELAVPDPPRSSGSR